ncbi:MAG: hypothetical protein FD130_166 [Halothiobacillaceae bacterium]|nr:MAG: hypothetical protein FD130_166 [Halothiobacillaceae bacterium]
MNRYTIAGAVLVVVLLNPVYAASSSERAIFGAIIGGAFGAAIGDSAGGRDGAIMGSAIGAATGVAISTHDNRSRYAEREHPTVIQRQEVYYYQYEDRHPRHHDHGYGRHRGHHGHHYRRHHHGHHDDD